MKFNQDKKGYKVVEVDSYLLELAKQYNSVTEAQRERIDQLRRQLADAEDKIAAYKEKTGQITKAILNAVEKADDIERLSRQKYSQELARLKVFHERWVAYYYRILEKYPLDDELIAAGEFGMSVRHILAKSTLELDDAANIKMPEQLERTFNSEKQRLEKKQIGYITVKTDESDDDDNEELLKMLPDADPNSPILSGDPLERIRRYLSAEKNKETDSSGGKVKIKGSKSKKGSSNKKVKAEFKEITTSLPDFDFGDFETATTKIDSSGSGFDFDEALNPKDDLATIMRDLGVLLD